jgi:hypothetical protein
MTHADSSHMPGQLALYPRQEAAAGASAPSAEPIECLDHLEYGYLTASCPMCWSEIKAGERSRQMLGHVLEGGC